MSVTARLVVPLRRLRASAPDAGIPAKGGHFVRGGICREVARTVAFTMKEFCDSLLGPDGPAAQLTWVQLAMRTLVVFLFGVAAVRMADRRFLGKNAGFDVLLAIVLGSVLSRAINGQAPLFKTLDASALLVLLHRLLSAATCRWSTLSKLVKGNAVLLVKDGEINHRAIRRAHISMDDLKENLRLNGNVADLAEVAEAWLERDGRISVVRRDK
jgi:uncharacterized membrane protein YcaP (DUF421 family)